MYELLTDGRSLTSISVSRDLHKTDSFNEPERIIQQTDTTLEKLDRTNFERIVSKIDSKPRIDPGRAKDLYRFEVYIGHVPKKNVYGYDEDIYSLIQLLRPFIADEKIQCCEFFPMFDNANK